MTATTRTLPWSETARRLPGALAAAGLLAALLSPAGCALLGGSRTEGLVVASDLDNPPFAWVDAEGTPRGRDVEMMEELGALVGRPIVWRRMPFAELLPAVEVGAVDVVCATLGVTEERARRVAFTRPYFVTSLAVVVRRGPGEPDSLAALAGRTVSAARGTTSQRAVELLLPDATGLFENKSGLPTAERLARGEVDAAVMDGPAADALVRADTRLRRLDVELAPESYALAVPRGREALRAALDEALARLATDGRLAELDAAHGLSGAPPPQRRRAAVR